MQTTIDDKGKIEVPEDVRRKLHLKTGDVVEIEIKDKNILISPLISPEEFIERMEGKIKSGNKSIAPEEIKNIWKM
jgi:AbrB family looped-hinge helix DNA binding protein